MTLIAEAQATYQLAPKKLEFTFINYGEVPGRLVEHSHPADESSRTASQSGSVGTASG
jgi:hypothetical protein